MNSAAPHIVRLSCPCGWTGNESEATTVEKPRFFFIIFMGTFRVLVCPKCERILSHTVQRLRK